MQRIHWLGAGLSSIPGIRRLARSDCSLIVWNRTLAKAQAAIADSNSAGNDARTLDWMQLASNVMPGDILVSMLPADMHLSAARLCLEKRAHFVSSSYISEDIAGLNEQVSAAGLCFVNECGLDPGLDHLFAHALLYEYRHSDVFNMENAISFQSYCGGFPLEAGSFTYKFSWSPLGVLKALNTPARWIANGQERYTAAPYREIETYRVNGEPFEAYPNRDSLPFIKQYQIGDNWKIDNFTRGTLRLPGWAKAWEDIFQTVEQASGEVGTRALAELSEQLWQRHQYAAGEPDRVVLCVRLSAAGANGGRIWGREYLLDSIGNERGSAMARLVSIPVSLVVEAILGGEVKSGVAPVPSDQEHIDKWIELLRETGENIILRDWF